LVLVVAEVMMVVEHKVVLVVLVPCFLKLAVMVVAGLLMEQAMVLLMEITLVDILVQDRLIQQLLMDSSLQLQDR
jgi:hypothetical protein